MTSYVPPKKNAAFIMYLGLPSQASTVAMQSTPTLAAGDAKVSIDGGALANLTTLPAVAPASSKMVKVSLSADEMNGDNITLVLSDAAGAEWCDVIVNIQTSARQIDDLATQASVDTVDGIVDAILTDTAEIGAAGAGLTALATQASVNDLPTNAELATALGTADDAVLAQVALVKAKTDSLTFTVAGQVDANIKSVAGGTITGTGSEADPWGP